MFPKSLDKKDGLVERSLSSTGPAIFENIGLSKKSWLQSSASPDVPDDPELP